MDVNGERTFEVDTGSPLENLKSKRVNWFSTVQQEIHAKDRVHVHQHIPGKFVKDESSGREYQMSGQTVLGKYNCIETFTGDSSF